MRISVFHLVISCAAAATLAACGEKESVEAKAVEGCAPSPDGVVRAQDGWVRTQSDANGMSAAYLTIVNCKDEPVTLTGLSTPLAQSAEIHASTRSDDGVVSMAPAGDIEIAPGEIFELAPGGYHAMLMKLAAPINDGDETTLTLRFGDDLAVTLPVAARTATAAASHQH